MTLNALLADSGKIFIQFLADIAYFPVWWYSRGFFKVLVWAKNFMSARLRGLALLVWLKNLFTPMFGQRDWVGKLISFFMRLFQIGVRSVGLVFWILYTLVAVLLWLIVPIFIIYQIILQLT